MLTKLGNEQAIWPTDNIIVVSYVTNKGNHMYTTQKYYKYEETKNRAQIKD
jgi:hypothetical protein